LRTLLSIQAASRASEGDEARHGSGSLLGRQAAQERPDSIRVEQRPAPDHSRAGLRQSKGNPPPVDWMTIPPDEPRPDQPIDQQRHGGKAHLHQPGKLRQGATLGGGPPELGQDSGLVSAHPGAGGALEAALLEGVVEHRIGGEDLGDGIARHPSKLSIVLLFVKSN